MIERIEKYIRSFQVCQISNSLCLAEIRYIG
nr:MAG TPA: hypothetical protein [Caudoviricetes sp.]